MRHLFVVCRLLQQPGVGRGAAKHTRDVAFACLRVAAGADSLTSASPTMGPLQRGMLAAHAAAAAASRVQSLPAAALGGRRSHSPPRQTGLSDGADGGGAAAAGVGFRAPPDAVRSLSACGGVDNNDCALAGPAQRGAAAAPGQQQVRAGHGRGASQQQQQQAVPSASSCFFTADNVLSLVDLACGGGGGGEVERALEHVARRVRGAASEALRRRLLPALRPLLRRLCVGGVPPLRPPLPVDADAAAAAAAGVGVTAPTPQLQSPSVPTIRMVAAAGAAPAQGGGDGGGGRRPRETGHVEEACASAGGSGGAGGRGGPAAVAALAELEAAQAAVEAGEWAACCAALHEFGNAVSNEARCRSPSTLPLRPQGASQSAARERLMVERVFARTHRWRWRQWWTPPS